MIKILLVEDHVFVRRGVIDILGECDLPVHIEEASDMQSALKALREKQFDLLIVDISLPDGNGLALFQAAQPTQPAIKTLFLTMQPEKRYARRVFKAGAHGYLTKDRAAEELIQAVRTIINGGKFVTSSLAELLVNDLNPDSAARHQLLSDREYQVVVRLAEGSSVTEIAEAMSLSPKTVSTYRRRAFGKLHVNSIAELVRYMLAQHLIENTAE